MGISPPSDIVLDVARAADPTKYRAAANRLSELGSVAGSTEFAEVFRATVQPMRPTSTDAYSLRTMLQHDATVSSAGNSGKVYQDFEAFILQSFVETMLPKNAENLYGKGTAGGVWKSMLAEQIGAQLARAGGIGIARKILAAHPPENASIAPGSMAQTDEANTVPHT